MYFIHVFLSCYSVTKHQIVKVALVVNLVNTYLTMRNKGFSLSKISKSRRTRLCHLSTTLLGQQKIRNVKVLRTRSLKGLWMGAPSLSGYCSVNDRPSISLCYPPPPPGHLLSLVMLPAPGLLRKM